MTRRTQAAAQRIRAIAGLVAHRQRPSDQAGHLGRGRPGGVDDSVDAHALPIGQDDRGDPVALDDHIGHGQSEMPLGAAVPAAGDKPFGDSPALYPSFARIQGHHGVVAGEGHLGSRSWRACPPFHACAS